MQRNYYTIKRSNGNAELRTHGEIPESKKDIRAMLTNELASKVERCNRVNDAVQSIKNTYDSVLD